MCRPSPILAQNIHSKSSVFLSLSTPFFHSAYQYFHNWMSFLFITAFFSFDHFSSLSHPLPFPLNLSPCCSLARFLSLGFNIHFSFSKKKKTITNGNRCQKIHVCFLRRWFVSKFEYFRVYQRREHFDFCSVDIRTYARIVVAENRKKWSISLCHIATLKKSCGKWEKERERLWVPLSCRRRAMNFRFSLDWNWLPAYNNAIDWNWLQACNNGKTVIIARQSNIKLISDIIRPKTNSTPQ